MLVLRDISSKKYLGGALAIANNLANFSNNITLLSYLGEKKDLLFRFSDLNSCLCLVFYRAVLQGLVAFWQAFGCSVASHI